MSVIALKAGRPIGSPFFYLLLGQASAKLAPIMTKRINNTINRAKPPPNPNPPSTNPDIYKPPFGSKEELTWAIYFTL